MRDVLFSFYDFNMISLTTQCRVHLTIDAHIHTHTYTIRTHKYAHTCMHAHTLKLWNSPYDCPNSPSQDKQVICYHACPPQGGTHIDTHTCTQLVPYLHEAPQLPGTAQPRDTVYLFALRTGESTIAIDPWSRYKHSCLMWCASIMYSYCCGLQDQCRQPQHMVWGRSGAISHTTR